MSKRAGRSRAALDRELRSIEEGILRLADQVDGAIERAVRSLTTGDMRLAQQVVDDDAEVNRLRFDIEEACLALIATQQPAATDLRTVMAAMSVVVDLERMADHAAGIGRTVLRMGGEAPPRLLSGLPRMAEACRQMLRQSLQAFAARDTESARAVAERDQEIDDQYHQVFRGLVGSMVEDPLLTTRALWLLFAAHKLERIGDGITNIAERAVFMTTGVMRELNTTLPDPSSPA